MFFSKIYCDRSKERRVMIAVIFTAVRSWVSGNNNILEKVHLKFCKIILHLKATTPNYDIWGA